MLQTGTTLKKRPPEKPESFEGIILGTSTFVLTQHEQKWNEFIGAIHKSVSDLAVAPYFCRWRPILHIRFYIIYCQFFITTFPQMKFKSL